MEWNICLCCKHITIFSSLELSGLNLFQQFSVHKSSSIMILFAKVELKEPAQSLISNLLNTWDKPGHPRMASVPDLTYASVAK